VVTLSDESVQALAASIDRSSWSKRDSSFFPTPENVFEEEIPLQIEGSAMELDPRIQARQREELARVQANSDCRRYDKLCNGGPEDGKQCACRLTRAKLEAKESRLNNDICTLCGHHLGHHPAGPQGEGRSSCQFNIAAVT
jgi:hypothetical protein